MVNKSRGSALLTALMVVAIVVGIAFALSRTIKRQTHASEAMLVADQAYLYFQGMQYWAIHEMRTKKHLHKKYFGPIMFHQAKVSALLTDAQSRFNINLLQNPRYAGSFGALLKSIFPGMKKDKRYALEGSVVSWVLGGGDGRYYLHLDPPRRVPGVRLAHRVELKNVRGVTPEMYRRLSPYTVALPKSVHANLETASLPVLTAYLSGLSPATIRNIWHCEREMGLPMLDQNPSYCLQRYAPQAQSTLMVTNSRYYLLRAKISVAHRHYTMESLFYRVSSKKVSILWQTFSST